MTPEQALRLLGLEADTSWPEIRARYRERVRTSHPDVQGESPRTHRATARLNEAFGLLEPIYRRGLDAVPSAPVTPAPRARTTDTLGVERIDDDGLAIVAPHDEVFLRLHNALDRVGDVVYADPDAGYLEALLRLPGTGPAQLVVSLQGRSHATEAFFTLEALANEAPPAIADVVRLLARLVRAG